MTQTAAICKALLNGDALSIMNGFKLFFCTNLPREIGRSVEQRFGVIISRTPTKFKSKYGRSGIYYVYRLNNTEYNKEGIEKMRQYVIEQTEQSEYSKNSSKVEHTLFD